MVGRRANSGLTLLKSHSSLSGGENGYDSPPEHEWTFLQCIFYFLEMKKDLCCFKLSLLYTNFIMAKKKVTKLKIKHINV